MGKEGEVDHSRHKHASEEKTKRRHGCRIFRTNSLKKGTKWHTDPLMGNDRPASNYTAFLQQQRMCFICGLCSEVISESSQRPLVREDAPQKQDRKFQTATFRQEVISGRKSHNGAWYQDILTDWPSVVK
jgi:hypothetical protein